MLLVIKWNKFLSYLVKKLLLIKCKKFNQATINEAQTNSYGNDTLWWLFTSDFSRLIFKFL